MNWPLIWNTKADGWNYLICTFSARTMSKLTQRTRWAFSLMTNHFAHMISTSQLFPAFFFTLPLRFRTIADFLIALTWAELNAFLVTRRTRTIMTGYRASMFSTSQFLPAWFTARPVLVKASFGCRCSLTAKAFGFD